ncbi:MAG: aspartate racemase RacD, partial [Desulfobacteraceae bacterium]|nr:aspartate racemase RacD [Desulfobacteraceae bacterium]
GVQIAIIACTELSALGGKLPIKTIDAAQVLAMEIIQKAKSPKESP